MTVELSKVEKATGEIVLVMDKTKQIIQNRILDVLNRIQAQLAPILDTLNSLKPILNIFNMTLICIPEVKAGFKNIKWN